LTFPAGSPEGVVEVGVVMLGPLAGATVMLPNVTTRARLACRLWVLA
jgi:hypothetical protein